MGGSLSYAQMAEYQSMLNAEKYTEMLGNKQLTKDDTEKTFSFGTTNFNDIYTSEMSKYEFSPNQPNLDIVVQQTISRITAPYISAFQNLVKEGYTPDTTAVGFYNQALLTDVQAKGGTKANLISLADPKNTYEVFKTSDGWVSKDPRAPTTSSAAEKTSRAARPGAPEVAELGEKRRAGAQAASFLGLSSTTSKSSILSGE